MAQHMHPLQYKRAFSRRPDRSLGWAALESKQAASLASELAEPSSSARQALPSALLPFPPLARRRRSVLDVLKGLLVWIVTVQLCYLMATAILITIYRSVDPPATVLMAYRKWRFGWAIQAPRPISLRKVPRYVRSMLISVEDGKFYEHHGLDFEAFARAHEINKRLGKPLYGGSTLTMQVARTLFLVPEKSYIRKYLEVLTALELEALLPKDRILELYFGYAEWGKGLFGIESAARRWYGRGVAGLSREEAASLIALLSSPVKYGPETQYKNGILRERYRYLIGRFVAPAEAPAAAPPPSIEPGSESPGDVTPETPDASAQKGKG